MQFRPVLNGLVMTQMPLEKKKLKKNRKKSSPESRPSSLAQDHSFLPLALSTLVGNGEVERELARLVCFRPRVVLQKGRDGLCSLSLAHSCEPGCEYAHINMYSQ